MSDGLHDKMRALADGGHPRAADLRELADKFEEGVAGYYSDPPTVEAKSFLGRWARARKLYCECTGESLI